MIQRIRGGLWGPGQGELLFGQSPHPKDHSAQDRSRALEVRWARKDPFQDWSFQRMKNINGVELTGPGTPVNELLLDYRA